ncbi:MAG: hypothetical protein IPM45_06640 [Acidimicrobiales bacterium]|nr:hypothetical protein [Acidimicrobiales bacterium]
MLAGAVLAALAVLTPLALLGRGGARPVLADPAPAVTAGPPTTVVPPTTAPPVTTAAPPPVETTTTTAPAPPPPPPPDRRVLLVGDSVLLGARADLERALDGWETTIDAEVGRFLGAGVGVLQARRDRAGAAAVIVLGNNYLGSQRQFADQLDDALQALSGVPRVLWLTVAEYDDDQWEVNAAIRAAAARWPNLEVVDWAAAVAGRPGLTGPDGLHLSPAGARALAGLVVQAVGPAPG